MINILSSSEFWAAVAGGLLALIGSYFSLRWQNANSQRERSSAYSRFYDDSLNFITSIIVEIDDIWKKEHYISFRHLDHIERILAIVDRHMDGFALIDDTPARIEVRQAFFQLYGDLSFLRFWEKKKEDHKSQFQTISDKSSAVASESRANYAEANSVITARLSEMRSRSNIAIRLFPEPKRQ